MILFGFRSDLPNNFSVSRAVGLVLAMISFVILIMESVNGYVHSTTPSIPFFNDVPHDIAGTLAYATATTCVVLGGLAGFFPENSAGRNLSLGMLPLVIALGFEFILTYNSSIVATFPIWALIAGSIGAKIRKSE